MEAFHARGPYVPSEQIKNNLPEPLVSLSDWIFPFCSLFGVCFRAMKNSKPVRQLSHPKSQDMEPSRVVRFKVAQRPLFLKVLPLAKLRYSQIFLPHGFQYI